MVSNASQFQWICRTIQESAYYLGLAYSHPLVRIGTKSQNSLSFLIKVRQEFGKESKDVVSQNSYHLLLFLGEVKPNREGKVPAGTVPVKNMASRL